MSIVMRFPGGKPKVFTMSYDDGVYQDIRLAKIMKKNGLKGAFNLISGNITNTDATKYRESLSEKQIKEHILADGHEIALHTYSHCQLANLPVEHVTLEYLKDKEILEKLTGKIIRGSGYPYSSYNSDTIQALKACGVVYARSGDESENFMLPADDDWMQLKCTVRHRNPRLFELGERFISYTPPIHFPCKMFYLLGHSYEFDDADNWDVIEKFAEMIGGHDDIWYATGIEIYDYICAYKAIRFNLAKTIAENPTSTDVWIAKDGEIIKLEAGKTTSI